MTITFVLDPSSKSGKPNAHDGKPNAHDAAARFTIACVQVIDAPDAKGQADGQWEKVWDVDLETVVYRNAAGREVTTAEEAEIVSAVEDAPDPPPQWRKKWSKMRRRVLYKHRSRDGVVAGSMEAVLRLEDQWDPPIPGWEKEPDPIVGVMYVGLNPGSGTRSHSVISPV